MSAAQTRSRKVLQDRLAARKEDLVNPATSANQSTRNLSAAISGAFATQALALAFLTFSLMLPRCVDAGTASLAVSGTVTYTGSQGPVSAAKPIGLFLTRNPTLDGIPVAVGSVETNGGSFELTAPEAGDYYLAYFLDSNGDSIPNVGDPFGVYNNRLGAQGDPITVPVSESQSNLMITFDDTAGLPGVTGTVTYTGSMGPVDDTRPIQVQIFREGDLTDRVDREQRLVTNGASYEVLLPESRLFYMQVFLDLNDNGVRDPGEPFEIYPDRQTLPGDPLPGGVAQVDVVFGDGPDPTPTPDADLVVSGTIEYTGARGPVSAERPILMFLSTSPVLDGAPVAGTLVTENGGAFELGAPAPGTYYLAYLLDTNGDMSPAVGDPFEVYMDRTTLPGDPLTVPLTNLTLSFDDTGGLPGVVGTVTYTGSLGPVSADKPILIDTFRDADLTDRLDQQYVVANNGDPFSIILLDAGQHYLRAFLDLNKNDVPDPGEPLIIFNGKTAPPGDPIPADGSMVNISFGDQPGQDTPTPTPTSLSTATAAATATATVPATATPPMATVTPVLASTGGCQVGKTGGSWWPLLLPLVIPVLLRRRKSGGS